MLRFGALVVSFVMSASVCLADDAHDRALMQAAYRGDLAQMQSELNAGADLGAIFSNTNSGFPVNAASAAVAGHSSAALRFVLSQATLSRESRLFALFIAFQLEDVDCSTLLADDLKPFTPDDPPVVQMLTDRAPEPVAAELQEGIRSVVFQEKLPDASEDLSILELGRFTKSPSGPAVIILDALVKAGADVNRPGDSFRPETGLITATRVGDRYLVQALRRLNAVLPDSWTESDINQCLLVGASRNGNIEAVTDLLAAGVDPSLKSKFENYSLAEASRFAQSEIVDKLLAAHANPDQWGKDQHSPLVSAVETGNANILSALLKAGANTSNRSDTEGWPLRVAVRKGSYSLVQLLIKSGAPVMDRDQRGRTVLHDYNLADSDLAVDNRPMSQADFTVVKYLAKNGFDFAATDKAGRSVIGSILQWGGANVGLVQTMLDSGAPVTNDAVRESIRSNDAPALELLLARAQKVEDPDLLDLAFGMIGHEPKLALLLVKAGVPLPSSQYTIDSAFMEAASVGATDLVAGLIERGVSANTHTSYQSALSLAVERGQAETAKLLFEKGADPRSYDYSGGTVFHDLVRADIKATPPNLALGNGQQQAIAGLISAGFDATQKNRDGKTASDLAVGHLETISRIANAIGLAETKHTKAHEAVRNDDLKTLTELKASGEDLNALDSLGRSPLTLALQLRRYEIADYLLSSGVEFTIEARNAYQRADLDYASDERLSQAFMLRMLRTQLLNLGPNEAFRTPQVSLQRFADNQGLQLQNGVWSLTCKPCIGMITLQGSEHAKLPIESLRTDDQQSTTYSITQMAVGPITVTGLLNFELNFTVNFSLTIPGCSFDFASDPTCFPEVDVHNPNEPSPLMANTWTGPVPLFPTTVIHAQQGESSWPINPGETIALDRSNGAIQLSIEPVVSKVFALGVVVVHSIGPSVPQPSSLEQIERAKVYAQLAKWQGEIASLPSSGQPNISMRAKTLASAVHVLSARAVDRNFASHVREALRNRALDVAALDKQTLELREAILSQSELSAGDLDLLIARVDRLITTIPPSAKIALQQIRDQLVSARAGLHNSTDKLRIFSERFFSDVDRLVRDYQVLILELAQYIPVDDLDKVLTPNMRNEISARLEASNTIIDDGALNGQGGKIRDAFGLPEPRGALQ